MSRALLKVFVYWLYRFLMWSWRIRIEESEEFKAKKSQAFIFAHWHGDELALLHMVRRYQLATMTSTSKDGALIDYVINRLGGKTTRGSSTRGGVGALKGLIKLIRQGSGTSMAVDGPRGPIYEVKPGVFELAKLGKAPIFPLGVACENKYVSEKSWNKAILPKPFAKVYIEIGPPIEQGHDPKSPEMASTLKQALANAKQQASKGIANQ